MAAALNLANQTGTSVFHERQTRDRHLAVIGQQYGGKTHIDPVLDRSGCVTDHLRTLGDNNGIVQFDISVKDSDHRRLPSATDGIGGMRYDLCARWKL